MNLGINNITLAKILGSLKELRTYICGSCLRFDETNDQRADIKMKETDPGAREGVSRRDALDLELSGKC